MNMIQPIRWDNEGKTLTLIDQTRLPGEEVYRRYEDPGGVAEAIRTLVVRGAPAIGCAAAFGVVLAARRFEGDDPGDFADRLREDMRMLAGTRPTAVNLFWAIERMGDVLEKAAGLDLDRTRAVLEAEAVRILDEDLASCRSIGDHGAGLVPEGARVLTHCNAGALATAGYGTALGVIRSAHRRRRVKMVWVDETRPVLQGARLTAWEMLREGIPATLITDNSAGALIASGRVDLIVVGADRIAANGDAANKIGTYTLAVLADLHKIPFIVAAPVSTIDAGIASGEDIPIETRDPGEVSGFGGVHWAPEGMPCLNLAFDVTPASLVGAIVTEKGVARPPYRTSIASLVEGR